MEELYDLLEFRCILEDCCKLEVEVKEEEIRKVLFVISVNKLLGRDGYVCEFFKVF